MFSLNVPAKYSNSVYETIRPLYISSRFFGMLSFSATITKPSSNEIYLTKIDRFLFIIHVLAYISLAAINLNLDVYNNASSSKLLKVGINYQMVLGCIFGCVIVIFELTLRPANWNIIESINDFDLKVQNGICIEN